MQKNISNYIYDILQKETKDNIFLIVFKFNFRYDIININKIERNNAYGFYG